jgi:hypothetical protein
VPESKIAGDLIEIVVTPASPKDTTLRFSGRAAQDKISGEIQVLTGQKNSKERWEAKRLAGTAGEIDN